MTTDGVMSQLELQEEIIARGKFSMSLRSCAKTFNSPASLLKWMKDNKFQVRDCWRGEEGVEFYRKDEK